MNIREAAMDDEEGIRNVYLSAFPEEERQTVLKLALDLFADPTKPASISLVADLNDVVVGHVAFSPVSNEAEGGFQGYILAPLAVRPDYQKQGIGSQLIRNGINRLSESGVSMLLVYGDPKYYGRFGFSTDFAENFVPPYELQYPFGWQGMALIDNDPPPSPIKINCVHALCDPTLW